MRKSSGYAPFFKATDWQVSDDKWKWSTYSCFFNSYRHSNINNRKRISRQFSCLIVYRQTDTWKRGLPKIYIYAHLLCYHMKISVQFILSSVWILPNDKTGFCRSAWDRKPPYDLQPYAELKSHVSWWGSKNKPCIVRELNTSPAHGYPVLC